MPSTATIISCFIASPGDTDKEREICERLFEEFNRGEGRSLGVRLESKRWEFDVRPAIGNDGQQVINKQLGRRNDLFIGILRNRFGSPTPRAGSGTEDEFELAYSCYQQDQRPDLMIYFFAGDANRSEIIPSEIDKINEFKIKVSDLGCLYATYKNYDDLEHTLRRDIRKFAEQHAPGENSVIDVSPDGNSSDPAEIALESRVTEALALFGGRSTKWIDRSIAITIEPEDNNKRENTETVSVDRLVENPKNLMVKAPPQFGQTCLAHYLCLQAWRQRKVWVYLDAESIDIKRIDKELKQSLSLYPSEYEGIDCLVVDSWNSAAAGMPKLLRTICNNYKDLPIIVMRRVDSIPFAIEPDLVKLPRDFEECHLVALSRNCMRNLVADYNSSICLADDDVLLEKISRDLQVLNAHRTPHNCLTLLRVAEKYFDESPANRTKVVELVLLSLFDLNSIPTYSARPDVKDCEFVLGSMADRMMRSGEFAFTRESFLNEVNSFCEERLISLDVHVLFDVLYENNIVVEVDGEFKFRSAYWIYYFAAQRMHVDQSFRDYIINEKCLPEIIEFYTGIDRSRADVLKVLKGNLEKSIGEIATEINIDEEADLFAGLAWDPTIESLKGLSAAVLTGPETDEKERDRVADMGYNPLAPYDQRVIVRELIEGQRMLRLKSDIMAASRALRNSDYVDPDIKKELMSQIARGLNLWAVTIFLIAPSLANKGYASYDGQSWILSSSFDKTDDQLLLRVLTAIPYNVVKSFSGDLSSKKIGPLLFRALRSQTNALRRHLFALIISSLRPDSWRKELEEYIHSLPKESFYLQDLLWSFMELYTYSSATESELKELAALIKRIVSIHEHGKTRPTLADLKKVSNRVLPDRNQEDMS